ncbi:MAG: tetratricopeptide repeat protein [Deltaproteobacteria bacterium]|nr:tetratricopeptide repeat protein [Deltaproteobacteria bacterium]
MSLNQLSIAAESLFSTLSGQQDGRSALAQAALSKGADRALAGDLNGAILDFKRAAALDTNPDAATQAYDLLASVYLRQGQSADAIAAYRIAVRISPTNADVRLKLGNVYFSDARYAEAAVQYQAAHRVDPSSATAELALGQVAMATGKLTEAEGWFRQVVGMNPGHYGGYYALGQAYAKAGKRDEAVLMFERTLTLKWDFTSAYVDLGSVYVDQGRWDEAARVLTTLQSRDPALATVLQGYIEQHEPPAISGAYSGGGFPTTFGPGTPVATLGGGLATPAATQVFGLEVVFSKAMDPQSVMNPANWSISRAPSAGPGLGYNWGRPLPASEAVVLPLPQGVTYDTESNVATVYFQVRQNATADATLDPRHLCFRFRGVDAYGNAMRPAADEFSGATFVA